MNAFTMQSTNELDSRAGVCGSYRGWCKNIVGADKHLEIRKSSTDVQTGLDPAHTLLVFRIYFWFLLTLLRLLIVNKIMRSQVSNSRESQRSSYCVCCSHIYYIIILYRYVVPTIVTTCIFFNEHNNCLERSLF